MVKGKKSPKQHAAREILRRLAGGVERVGRRGGKVELTILVSAETFAALARLAAEVTTVPY
jgi:hypothetical protein